MRKGKAEAEGLEIFSGLLFSSTYEKGLAAIEPVKLARFAQEAFAHLVRKPHKRHAIGFRSTDLLAAADGADANLLVLEILNDDMPFVVESVMGELHSRGLDAAPGVPSDLQDQALRLGQPAGGGGPRRPELGGGRPGKLHRRRPRPDRRGGAQVACRRARCRARRRSPGRRRRRRDPQSRAAGDRPGGGDATRPRSSAGRSRHRSISRRPSSSCAGCCRATSRCSARATTSWSASTRTSTCGPRRRARSASRADPMHPHRSGAGSRQSRAACRPNARKVYEAASLLVVSKGSEVEPGAPPRAARHHRHQALLAAGKLLGELRVVGLFTPASYMQPVEAVPLVAPQGAPRPRRGAVPARQPQRPHAARYPRDVPARRAVPASIRSSLHDWSMTLLDLELRPRVRVLAAPRRDRPLAIPCSCSCRATTIPRPRARASGAIWRPRSAGASRLPALHHRPAAGAHRSSPSRMATPRRAASIRQSSSAASPSCCAPGTSALALAIAGQFPPGRAAALAAAFARCVLRRLCRDLSRSSARSRTSPASSGLAPNGPSRSTSIASRMRPPIACARRSTASITPIPLSERVPLLENLGFRVIDERSHRIRPVSPDGGVPTQRAAQSAMSCCTTWCWRLPTARRSTSPAHEARMEDAFLAVFHGEAENDPFNRAGRGSRARLARGGGDAGLCGLHAPDPRAVQPALYRRDAGALLRRSRAISYALFKAALRCSRATARSNRAKPPPQRSASASRRRCNA